MVPKWNGAKALQKTYNNFMTLNLRKDRLLLTQTQKF